MDAHNFTEVGLTTKDITNIAADALSKKKSSISPVDRNKNQVRDMHLREAEITPDIPPEKLQAIFEREDLFLHIVKDTVTGIETDSPAGEITDSTVANVRKRIAASDLTTLYHLLVDDGLDRLYEQHIQVLQENGLPQPKGKKSILRAKIELALQYVDHVRQKNQEAAHALSEPHPVTFGIEIEYSDRLLLRYDELVRYYKVLFDQRGIRFRVETPLTDMQLPQGSPEEYYEDLERYKELLRIFGFSQIPNSDETYEIHDNIEKNPSVTNTLKALPFTPLLNDQVDLEVQREATTTPSASYKTQLREFLFAYLAGGIPGEPRGWNIHITIGGIDLTPDHVEIMDQLLLSTAAGFTTSEESMQIAEGSSDAMGDIRERYYKSSYVSSGDLKIPKVYFPFHRRREERSSIVQPYPGPNTPPAVERRTMFSYLPYEFPNFVREMHFTQSAAWAIRALQLPTAQQRTTKDRQFIRHWNNLQAEWTKLLSHHALPILNPNRTHDYFTKHEYVKEFMATTQYEKLLSSLHVLSRDDPEFRSQTRTIIREFNANMRKTWREYSAAKNVAQKRPEPVYVGSSS